MSVKDVRAAIVEEYQIILPSLKTAFENIEFTPPNDENWAEFEFEVESVFKAELGRYGSETGEGVFKLVLHGKKNAGYSSLRTEISALAGAFGKGRMLSSNGQTVTIVSSSVTPSVEDPSNFEITFEANWRASVLR